MEKVKGRLQKILQAEILFISLWRLLTLIIAVAILTTLYYRGIITIATVNDQRITLKEVLKFAKREPQNALDLAINQELIEYEARKRDIIVTSQEVNAEIDRLTLVALRNGQTVQELMEDPDLKLEELQKVVKLQLTYYKILGEKPYISEEEIEEFLDESNVPYTEAEREFVEAEIRQILFKKKADAEYDNWIREARAASDIDYVLDTDLILP